VFRVGFTAWRDIRAAARKFGCDSGMHFSYYLLMAALVVIGLEAIYSLYQLATFVL
jgi:hypothetical protein